MFKTLVQLSGGIGMFLLGMSLLTDSLKAMAGESLRQWLGKFTGSPIKAMMSGIGFTLVVQSSTATTLATIGFVSAGALSFVQAIGVIIGANIGTTSTGWLVALLGLKFSIASVALPMVAIGAMMKLLGKNSIALVGLSLAGFGLLFIGIDVLQEAMAGFAQQVDLSAWSNDSLLTKIILVLVGVVMTLLLQSSSAAITATLAAVAGGAIDLPQALALGIGQHIGTVATAVLAALGATISAKRTAAVHVMFNLVAAVAAFFILMPVMTWAIKQGWFGTWDNVLIIALYHTLFAVCGALIFMPLIDKFQQLLTKLLPEKQLNDTTRYLDESLFSVPAVAIATAKNALCLSLSDVFRQVVQAGEGKISGDMLNIQPLDECLLKVDDYLSKMPVPQAQSDQEHLMKLFQMIVYSRVIRDDLLNANFIDVLRTDLDTKTFFGAMTQFRALGEALGGLPKDKNALPEDIAAAFVAFGDEMRAKKTYVRLSIIEQSANEENSAANTLDLIVARRWLDRLVKHTAKAVKLLAQ